MSDLDKFHRAVELARRAGALENELTAVKRELQELAGEVAGAVPLPAVSIVEMKHDASGELKAPLQARVLSVFRKNPSKPLTASEVAKALNEEDKTKLISAYLTRFMQQGDLKRLGRGSYTLPPKS